MNNLTKRPILDSTTYYTQVPVEAIEDLGNRIADLETRIEKLTRLVYDILEASHEEPSD